MLSAGEALHEAGCKKSHVYFPTTSIVSLLCDTECGASCETCTVGNEGVVGFALFMGGETTSSSAVVSSAGHAYRMPSSRFRLEFDRCGTLMHVLLRYSQVLLTQMGQTAMCNRHHSVEQQLCRRLLTCLDCLPGDELAMTHERIANTLGVRREGITVAAGRLQAAGVIRYVRGHIKVLDRDALEARSCECYGVVRHEADRLMPRALRIAQTA
jgi:CRP-like cAMP-binding protein